MSNLTNNISEGYRAVLKNKNFLALWLGQIFSQIGDRVVFVIFVAVIAALHSTSTTLQSWLYISFTIPAVLLTAIAGVFVDRWSKQKTLIITNVLRAILLTLLPFFDHTLLGIYLLAFLVSSVTQFFVPAEASSIPTLVKKQHLLPANSLFTTTMMGSIVFGFVLGDPLINIFGLNSVHLAVSFLFLISAAILMLIKYPEEDTEIHKNKTFKDFYSELKQGFVYIKNNTTVLNAILKLSTLFSIIVMLSILAISISQHVLYPTNPALGAQKFAYIIAFSGLGMVIGSIIVGKVLRNVNKYIQIYTGFAIIGINLILLTTIGLIPNNLHIRIEGHDYWFIHLETIKLTLRMIYAYFLATVIGFGSSLVAVPVQTILHTSVAEDMRGKVFGVQFTFLSTSSTLPVLLVAAAADVMGLNYILLILGLPIMLFGGISLARIKKLGSEQCL